ncbi:hypothetical protein DFJ73DRAFT_763731 [Zopfochytrium polystomum]|nr:hypothetical protein DFJ73DRAFT_763731 [Zopfochytrium polystomum]
MSSGPPVRSRFRAERTLPRSPDLSRQSQQPTARRQCHRTQHPIPHPPLSRRSKAGLDCQHPHPTRRPNPTSSSDLKTHPLCRTIVDSIDLAGARRTVPSFRTRDLTQSLPRAPPGGLLFNRLGRVRKSSIVLRRPNPLQDGIAVIKVESDDLESSPFDTSALVLPLGAATPSSAITPTSPSLPPSSALSRHATPSNHSIAFHQYQYQHQYEAGGEFIFLESGVDTRTSVTLPWSELHDVSFVKPNFDNSRTHEAADSVSVTLQVPRPDFGDALNPNLGRWKESSVGSEELDDDGSDNYEQEIVDSPVASLKDDGFAHSLVAIPLHEPVEFNFLCPIPNSDHSLNRLLTVTIGGTGSTFDHHYQIRPLPRRTPVSSNWNCRGAIGSPSARKFGQGPDISSAR